MRHDATQPERRLWNAIRADQLGGARFRRQVVIGRYIVDFECRRPTMLIVEVDGDTHAERRDYDAARTTFLNSRGYRVIRFTNDDVMTNIDGVLLTVGRALLTPPLPDLLPASGERE